MYYRRALPSTMTAAVTATATNTMSTIKMVMYVLCCDRFLQFSNCMLLLMFFFFAVIAVPSNDDCIRNWKPEEEPIVGTQSLHTIKCDCANFCTR